MPISNSNPQAAKQASVPGMPADRLDSLSARIGYENDGVWAWRNYKATLQTIIKHYRVRSILEIGGGRYPLFSQEETIALGVNYTVNDILQSELDRAPHYVDKRCFDVSIGIPFRDTYDLVFSKMVFEHVKDVRAAYSNLFSVMNSNGIILNYHPTLYSPPFVINRFIPEHLSRNVLGTMFPHRNDDEIPKFPAWYSWCRATDDVAGMIHSVGYRDALILPFYGHTYYQNIPGIRGLSSILTRYFKKNDVRLMSSYAYTIARK